MQTTLACDLANRLLVVTVLLGTVEDLKGAYKMNRVRYSLDIENQNWHRETYAAQCSSLSASDHQHSHKSAC